MFVIYVFLIAYNLPLSYQTDANWKFHIDRFWCAELGCYWRNEKYTSNNLTREAETTLKREAFWGVSI